MKLKIALASATAMGLLIGAVYAGDDNNAYIDQDGEANSASIQQLGTGAKAGDSSANRRMLQDGDNNTLVILQNNGGTIGTGGNYQQNNRGLDQTGDRNQASITQTYGSGVYEVQQDASGATGTVSATTNELTITQTGNMRVNRVNQTYTGNGSTDGANSLTISQTGSQFHNSFVGNSNGLQHASQGAFQTGHSNDADVTQNGAGQRLIRLNQDGVSNDFDLMQGGGNGNLVQTAEQIGNRNTGYLSFSGANNGKDGFTAGTPAALAGAAASSMSQIGDDNKVNMEVLGSRNQFGFYQDGDRNTAVGITLLGDDNQLGVFQMGEDNTLNLGTVDGNLNNIGLDQDGVDNTATVSVTGNSNIADFSQESNDNGNTIIASIDGDLNDLTINQTVGASSNARSQADVSIDGDRNYLDVRQNSARLLGGAQTVNVTIVGNDNNNLTAIGHGFDGSALAVGLTPGTITQELNGSEANLDVTGNNNLFAFFQRGNTGGSITGTITGSDNQAAVSQRGADNVTAFTQIGDGNNLGVTQ